jgi:predicted chitinase
MNYKVKSGDTLSSIARRYHTVPAALGKLNGLQNLNNISAGQSLKILDSFAGQPTVSKPVKGDGFTPDATAGAAAAGGVTGAGATGNFKGVNAQQLQRMMPGLSKAKAEQMTPHINAAMQQAGINTPKRQAAFLAQMGHESGSLRYMEELASGKAYEGRKDLGNTQPGDGARFKGRGLIQLTGRANYTAASKDLGLDLVKHPELAAKPENAAKIAAWFWQKHGLNQLADSGKFDTITRRINGGTNGAADRNARYALALREIAVP